MFEFSSPMGDRLLTLSGPEPFDSVTMSGGDDGDLSAEVEVLGPSPWFFVCVIHSDDTVTKPLSAAGITITVTR
jgi:hypothetical protein